MLHACAVLLKRPAARNQRLILHTRQQAVRNGLASVLAHDVVHTTMARARRLRPLVDRAVALTKRGTPEAIKELRSMMPEKNEAVIEKIMTDYPYRFANRNGFYCRVTRQLLGRRRDMAPLAVIELTERHRSFDVLYPQEVEHPALVTQATLEKRRMLGRWAEESDRTDPIMNHHTLLKRHPKWEPSDDDRTGKEARERIGGFMVKEAGAGSRWYSKPRRPPEADDLAAGSDQLPFDQYYGPEQKAETS
eukprot:TRINITY_DN2852_c0_g1_i1.p1 TRINITY_DN2852_c0_g1~~TRINITY_DN2852_c0_g1_i1.p1  ORF type:complete len:249 (-),score=83.78 TRINITY_DN2852_c0_g1_i1:32-778(-)